MCIAPTCSSLSRRSGESSRIFHETGPDESSGSYLKASEWGLAEITQVQRRVISADHLVGVASDASGSEAGPIDGHAATGRHPNNRGAEIFRRFHDLDRSSGPGDGLPSSCGTPDMTVPPGEV